MPIGMNLQMDMYGSALIPPWIDRRELGHAVAVTGLQPSQKARSVTRVMSAHTTHPRRSHPRRRSKPFRRRTGRSPSRSILARPATTRWRTQMYVRESRIHSGRIAVPNVQRRVRQRRAMLGMYQRNPQSQRHTGLTFRNVVPHLFVIDIERAFFLFRGQHTSWGGGHSTPCAR